jgi:hypothetical protein
LKKLEQDKKKKSKSKDKDKDGENKDGKTRKVGCGREHEIPSPKH